MKRVIISIIVALVVLTALYLFVERGVLTFGIREVEGRAVEGGEVSDRGVFNPVGESVEARYEQTAGLVALRLKRKIEIEDKKISTTDIFKCKSCGMCVVACPSNARHLVGDTFEQMIEAAYTDLQNS